LGNTVIIDKTNYYVVDCVHKYTLFRWKM